MEARRDLFGALAAAAQPAARGREASEIVIVGDSLVALAEWGELLPGRVVRNRGIPGDTTADLLARIDDAVRSRPGTVVVVAGMNDLLRGDAPDAVAQRHADIAGRIRTRCPQARLLIHALLPVRASMIDAREVADQVPVLNEKLRALAARVGAELVDARAALVDARGELDARLTTDGVHLNGAGYLRWRDVLDGALGDPNAPSR